MTALLGEPLRAAQDGARDILEVQGPQTTTWGAHQRRRLSAALAAALPEIGRIMCGPLAFALAAGGDESVALVPCGVLGALPIHAAPYDRDGAVRCLADEFAVSYVPSRGVLGVTSARLADRLDPLSLVAVQDPTGDLPFAAAELEDVLSRLGQSATRFPGEQARREDVVPAMRAATHLHFASHGRTLADRPLESHLVLAGGDRLTLAELLGAQTDERTETPELARARLLVASACQTAVIEGDRIPDEVVGPAAGFLQAGVPGFVGTLWPVGDMASALVMTRFYELVLPTGNRSPIAPDAALAAAGTWLRDLDGRGVVAFLEDHPDLAAASGSAATFAARDPNVRFFERPEHWAAHVFVGAAARESAPVRDGHDD